MYTGSKTRLLKQVKQLNKRKVDSHLCIYSKIVILFLAILVFEIKLRLRDVALEMQLSFHVWGS